MDGKFMHGGLRVENKRGEYVPAIVEPLIVRDWFGRLRRDGRSKCVCGRVFRTRQRYREHYALAHVLALD